MKRARHSTRRRAARRAAPDRDLHPAPPPAGPTSLTGAERQALADIRDELEAGDEALSRELHRLDQRPSPWWWLVVAVVIATVTAAVLIFGTEALGAVVLVIVLAAPLAVAAAGSGTERR